MENNMLFLSGIIVSCLVMTIIMFRFMDTRHKRTYANNYLFVGAKIGISIFFMLINLFGHSIVKLLSCMVVFGLLAYFFYCDNVDKPIYRILDAEVMVLVFAACEAVGVVLLDFVFWKTKIPVIDDNIRGFLNITFSMIVVVFAYYFVILPMWGKKERVKFTTTQCVIHIIIAIYNFLNLTIIVNVAGRIKVEESSLILLINMGFIIFTDLYFLYFIQFLEESNQLKTKVTLLEQQASLQYKYYEKQEKKYRESISILHDVDKHIMAIECLYKGENREEAFFYTKEINKILKPLIPKQLTNHPILNILLDDKEQIADRGQISIQYEIENVDLGFMNPIDITTIFGNLLDNALEACERVEGSRWIKMKVYPHYEMIAIRVENTASSNSEWVNGRPITQKGINHGIGLSNVERIIKKYDGSMYLNNENGLFQCNIIISK